jgi:hypothetical protein
MSNFLAIATVTATLRRTLQTTVPLSVPAADATAVRPDAEASGLPDTGVNIYLYQVTPNNAWRNTDVRTRNQAGQLVERPRIALDLHYLFTFYGEESLLEPQRVMGSVVQTLHARPFLPRSAIEETVSDPAFAYLTGSDLAEEVELVKFTPVPFNLEELSKLWSVLLQTTHSLSMMYIATVVLIEGADVPRHPLPVRERNITVLPFKKAIIDKVYPDSGEVEPIVMGDTIVIEGEQLDGAIEYVRVGVANLQPVPDSVTPTRLSVALTSGDLRAGVQGVQIVYGDGSASNIAAIVLRPDITVVTSGVSATEIPISFDPPVARQQLVELFINEIDPPDTRAPYAYSFKAPQDNGITNPSVDETTEVTFAISAVEPGDYVVRARVSGADNVLGIGMVGGVEQYNSPWVTVP